MSMRRRQTNIQPLYIPFTVAEKSSKFHPTSKLAADFDITTPTRSKHLNTTKIPEDFLDTEKDADHAAYDFSAEGVHRPEESNLSLVSREHGFRRDKAAQLLGIPHHASMEPIPVNRRLSLSSIRSAPVQQPVTPTHVPSAPLASLYVVSGLPKSPQTWTLADADAVHGLSHTEGAVNRWWRAEVLGSTVTPGVGGGKKRKSARGHTEVVRGVGALSKQETARMLSKSLKLSFTREVEIIASTLQPASTVHTFTFTLAAPSTPLAPPSSFGLNNLRTSILSTSTDENRFSNTLSNYGIYPSPYTDHRVRPSSAYIGPSNVGAHDINGGSSTASPDFGGAGSEGRGSGIVTYHGVCLTVWSHADADRSMAIRRALETRMRKESAQSLVATRVKSLRADISSTDPAVQARKNVSRNRRSPWNTIEMDTEGDSDLDGGAISESDVASAMGHNPGESTLFLPGDTIFWLPYALTLVSCYPIYDLMRDYLTLSWARFSKDVASHTLQISKILSHPAPRAGDIVRLDASPKDGGEKGDGSLEVVARFPGGIDFGRGLVDINFTMWPLFKCLNIDNILTICEIALAPTGRILFFSKHPALLGIAVATIKYLVELRGWNGIALPAVHSRDAKIYIEDPGPWIIGLAAEMRYAIRPAVEVCICDLDINYLTCQSPPPECLSVKQRRDKYRQKLLAAFGDLYHPDHSVPIEFKEAFPAGRFRPICKIQAKRGASSSIVTENIKSPEWWHSTKLIQAFDAVLQDKNKRPSFFKRMSTFRAYRKPLELSLAEQQIQRSIRKRATAFVDARDDLETKIGRLSRRLNFLMAESDLWREKFVTFEQYAENLSTEASELRAKINKEQKESKRLTGLISLSASEKLKLQCQLQDTENAHREAKEELERMKNDMEKMEEDRAQMIAEVEAQIEKALASMVVDLDDSDYNSQPSSPPSSIGYQSRPLSRTSSISHSRPLHSFSTESTLADATEEFKPHSPARNDVNNAISSPQPKRLSLSCGNQQLDAMTAVDEGIHQNSSRITQKVLQIQQKQLEDALHLDNREPSVGYTVQSDTRLSSEESTLRPMHSPSTSTFSDGSRHGIRSRSNTSSSSEATTRTTGMIRSGWNSKHHEYVTRQLTMRETNAALSLVRDFLPDSTPLHPDISVTPQLETSHTVDDSDTDFQSAYSTSPRESYCSLDTVETEGNAEPGANVRKHDTRLNGMGRQRVSSTATATPTDM